MSAYSWPPKVTGTNNSTWPIFVPVIFGGHEYKVIWMSGSPAVEWFDVFMSGRCLVNVARHLRLAPRRSNQKRHFDAVTEWRCSILVLLRWHMGVNRESTGSPGGVPGNPWLSVMSSVFPWVSSRAPWGRPWPVPVAGYPWVLQLLGTKIIYFYYIQNK